MIKTLMIIIIMVMIVIVLMAISMIMRIDTGIENHYHTDKNELNYSSNSTATTPGTMTVAKITEQGAQQQPRAR